MFKVSGSEGAFTRAPGNATLIPGTLLRLNCSTTLSAPVLWTFTAEESTNIMEVTDHNANVSPNFAPYFYIVSDSTSQYDLVAHTSNANESYCGTYNCIENFGVGDTRTATVASKYTYIR